MKYLFDNLEKIKTQLSTLGENKTTLPTILAVTKTQTVDKINAIIKLGICDIGENKAQELTEKYPDIIKVYENTKTRIHFIGRLQTNKVKYIIDKVDLIHSVDSIKLAEQINRLAANLNKVQEILIQVNIGNDPNKSGFDKNELFDAMLMIAKLPHVRIKGLMCILPILQQQDQISALFSEMYTLFVDIRAKNIDNISMEHLSMGMSGDYVFAVKNGATLIRLGSCLFGKREYK